MVTAGRIVKLSWPQQPRRKNECNPRLPCIFVPFPNVYVDQHWAAASRSRWDHVMSYRFSFKIAGQAANTAASQPPGTEKCFFLV